MSELAHDDLTLSARVALNEALYLRREPPVREAEALPRHAEEYHHLLGVSAPITAHNFGVTHLLPHRLAARDDVRLAGHGTPAGEALCAKIRSEGMPRHLVEAGFADLSHFWPPWCAALDGAEIASIAFTARLSARGAEVGVTTMTAFRGRGFAAAAVAGWSGLPALQDHRLFYGTHRDNLSSQRVIARLDLPFLGVRMQL